MKEASEFLSANLSHPRPTLPSPTEFHVQHSPSSASQGASNGIPLRPNVINLFMSVIDECP